MKSGVTQLLQKYLVVILPLTLSCGAVQAHHSFAATFTEQIIRVEGLVKAMRFNNPHVLVTFEVEDEQGNTTDWITEGHSATSMRRDGWSQDTLSAGDFIRVTGNSTRNGSPMVSMEEIVFVDPQSGRVLGDPSGEIVEDVIATNMALRLPNGAPNMTGYWTGEATGRVGGPHEGYRSLPYNEAGAALQADFDPLNDPQVQCEPPGLVRQGGFTPHPARIQQFDDRVVISYEEYGGVRTIYFDDRDLTGGEHSHLGHSIARYQAQKLIIETTNLRSNLVGTRGEFLSDQTMTVETYYRADKEDGRAALMMDMVVIDPGYLTRPWSIHWGKFATPGHEFIPVDCHKPLAY